MRGTLGGKAPPSKLPPLAASHEASPATSPKADGVAKGFGSARSPSGLVRKVTQAVVTASSLAALHPTDHA